MTSVLLYVYVIVLLTKFHENIPGFKLNIWAQCDMKESYCGIFNL